MSTSLSLHSIVIATVQQISCDLEEEAAILSLKNNVYYGLDPVGARIWRLLRQSRSVQELRDALLGEYEVESERCEKDLLGLLEHMRDEGLIEVKDSPNE